MTLNKVRITEEIAPSHITFGHDRICPRDVENQRLTVDLFFLVTG